MHIHSEKHLRDILAFVCDNPHSSFYADKYFKAGFARDRVLDPGSFDTLPFLTKAELEAMPADQRLFIDPKDVYFTAYTSGTTAQKPLVMFFGAVERYFYEPSLGCDISRPLITYAPLNKNFGHTFIQQCRQATRAVTPIFADFQNLSNSAVIARETRADAIYATPTIAALLAEHIAKHYDPANIKLLVLGSETLTPARRESLCMQYPNAKIANVYASSEIGQFILYPCVRMIEEGRDAFHVLHDAVAAAELIDGELVVTYGLNKAFPLVRYRTGDRFMEDSTGCACGIQGPVLVWAGRHGVDRIRASGAEITVNGVERAFSAVRHLIGDRYQLHFYSQPSNGRESVRIVIEVIDSDFLGDRNRATIAEEVVRTIPDALRFSRTATLRDAIAKGLFSVPEVVFVKEFSCPGVKMKRLVSHL